MRPTKPGTYIYKGIEVKVDNSYLNNLIFFENDDVLYFTFVKDTNEDDWEEVESTTNVVYLSQFKVTKILRDTRSQRKYSSEEAKRKEHNERVLRLTKEQYRGKSR